eukprot:s663_g20.t1
MAGGDFDGDLNMLSFNPLLLELAKATAPAVAACGWTAIEEARPHMQESLMRPFSEVDHRLATVTEELKALPRAPDGTGHASNGRAGAYEEEVSICQRSSKLLIEQLKFPPEDILFHPWHARPEVKIPAVTPAPAVAPALAPGRNPLGPATQAHALGSLMMAPQMQLLGPGVNV